MGKQAMNGAEHQLVLSWEQAKAKSGGGGGGGEKRRPRETGAGVRMWGPGMDTITAGQGQAEPQQGRAQCGGKEVRVQMPRGTGRAAGVMGELDK